MAWPAILAAGIAATASTGQGLANLYMQNKTNEVNWQHQMAMNSQNNNFNERMYLYDNAWNSPINQVQRLRAAGLNPALMYEGGGSVATSSPPPDSRMQSSTDVAPQMTGLPSIGDVLALAQAENLKAQTRKTEAETQTEDALREERLEALRQQNALMAKQTEETVERIKNYAKDRELTDAQIGQIKFDRMMSGKRYMLDKKRLEMDQKLSEKQIEALDADIQKTLAEKKVTEREYQEMIWTFAIRKSGLANAVNLSAVQTSQAFATARRLGYEADMLEAGASTEKYYAESLAGEHGTGNMIIAAVRSGVQMVTRDVGNVLGVFK